MKVFISQKMNGLSDGEAMTYRKEAINYLKSKYGNDLEFAENYYHDNPPENAGRLWYLGRSISLLDECDAIYFHQSAIEAKGGQIEMHIASLYDIKILK